MRSVGLGAVKQTGDTKFEEFREEVKKLKKENSTLRKEITELDKENAVLHEEIAALRNQDTSKQETDQAADAVEADGKETKKNPGR